MFWLGLHKIVSETFYKTTVLLKLVLIQKFCLSSFTYIALLEGHEVFQLRYFFIYCANKIKKTLHKASNEMIQAVSPRHCFNTFEKVFQLFCNWTTWFLLTIDPFINPSGRFKWGQAFSLVLEVAKKEKITHLFSIF